MTNHPSKDRNALGGMRAAVDAELERLLPAGRSRLFEAMRYAVLGGGKRFRPLVLLAVGEAFGAERSLLLPYACAVELIHNYSLVHDDLPAMDNDDVRRGKPSCHKAFGEGPALLAGDGLLSLAFEVLAGAPYPRRRPGAKNAALREIATAAGVRGMIEGQWLDITPGPETKTADGFLDMISKKTGALIRASAMSGALLAGAPAKGAAAALDYGTALGLAFQLRDDLADAGRSGSPSGIDAVSVFGRENARACLESCLTEARAALEEGEIASAELSLLAASLEPGKGM
ncbi:MAG: polyprenyl synthetase family protein [Acidobacteriota bacterium]